MAAFDVQAFGEIYCARSSSLIGLQDVSIAVGKHEKWFAPLQPIHLS